jgi:Tat protein translocase TatB subunit
MSLGPEKIILILVVALIVFGPHRLPEIARQVGAAMRELRRMQDTVRDELEHVLHPDYSPGTATTASTETASIEEADHAALPPGSVPTESPDPAGEPSHWDDNFTDDGFSGPRSFS